MGGGRRDSPRDHHRGRRHTGDHERGRGGVRVRRRIIDRPPRDPRILRRRRVVVVERGREGGGAPAAPAGRQAPASARTQPRVGEGVAPTEEALPRGARVPRVGTERGDGPGEDGPREVGGPDGEGDEVGGIGRRGGTAADGSWTADGRSRSSTRWRWWRDNEQRRTSAAGQEIVGDTSQRGGRPERQRPPPPSHRRRRGLLRIIAMSCPRLREDGRFDIVFVAGKGRERSRHPPVAHVDRAAGRSDVHEAAPPKPGPADADAVRTVAEPAGRRVLQGRSERV